MKGRKFQITHMLCQALALTRHIPTLEEPMSPTCSFLRYRLFLSLRIRKAVTSLFRLSRFNAIATIFILLVMTIIILFNTSNLYAKSSPKHENKQSISDMQDLAIFLNAITVGE